MTGIFDGITGIMTGILGAQIQYAPQDGTLRDVPSIFREQPIEVTGADGQIVLIDAPSWRVERNLIPEVRRGDIIRLEDGRLFRITTTHDSGSPAVDAFVICELHLAGT